MLSSRFITLTGFQCHEYLESPRLVSLFFTPSSSIQGYSFVIIQTHRPSPVSWLSGFDSSPHASETSTDPKAINPEADYLDHQASSTFYTLSHQDLVGVMVDPARFLAITCGRNEGGEDQEAEETADRFEAAGRGQYGDSWNQFR